MSERCERTSERTSEWPNLYVSILICSRPQCSAKSIKRELSVAKPENSVFLHPDVALNSFLPFAFPFPFSFLSNVSSHSLIILQAFSSKKFQKWSLIRSKSTDEEEI